MKYRIALFLYVVFICVLVCVGYTVVDVFVYELSCADTWVRIHTHVCVCVCYSMICSYT